LFEINVAPLKRGGIFYFAFGESILEKARRGLQIYGQKAMCLSTAAQASTPCTTEIATGRAPVFLCLEQV
jgi:hypothetical protein